MKRIIMNLHIAFLLTLCSILGACEQSENSRVERSIQKEFEKNVAIAKVHSEMLTSIRKNLPQTRSTVSETISDIHILLKEYIQENGLDVYFPTEQSLEYITDPFNYKDQVSDYLGGDFINDLYSLIESSTDSDNLYQNLLQLLEKHKDSSKIEDLLIVAGVAVDSYNYWENEQLATRSASGNIARIVEADALAAASFICGSGLVALFTGATPPGAAAIAGTAAFGSAEEGVTILFE